MVVFTSMISPRYFSYGSKKNKSSRDFPQKKIHEILDQVTPFLSTAEPWSENDAFCS